MSFFTHNDSIIRVSATDPRKLVTEKLGPFTYALQIDLHGYYLEKIESFTHKGKLYGNTQQQAERILNTFADRPNTTGVLLDGEKGSGKTLLARRISELAAEYLNLPTIIINAPFNGTEFNSTMQLLGPCVVLFDEFEKVYKDKNEQNGILTLLDGLYPSKKLFILTVNDRYAVNTLMMNRPGRIYYKLSFNGLSSAFIEEYLKDNLKDTKHINSIVTLAEVFAPFNFDMLKAYAEELNRYNEHPLEVLKYLNISASVDGKMTFDVKIEHPTEKVKLYERGSIHLIPLMNELKIDYQFVKPKRTMREDYDEDGKELPHPHPEYWNSDYWEYKTLKLKPEDLHNYNIHTGTYNYNEIDGVKCTLAKKELESTYINGVPGMVFKTMTMGVAE